MKLPRRGLLGAISETLESRRLLAAVAWDGGGDSLRWMDPLNWSNDLVPGSVDDVTLNVPHFVLIKIDQGVPVINSLVSFENLLVQGNNNFGPAALNVTTNVTNNGTVHLESDGAAWASTVIVGGIFTNAASGTFSSGVGFNGTRDFYGGVFKNQGAIDSSTYYLDLHGTFEEAGGTLTGLNRMRSVNVRVTANPVSLQTLDLYGVSTLETDVGANVELWVHGNGVAGGALLNVPLTQSNAGIIRLESTDSSYSADISVGGINKLVNSATGIIRSYAGAGGTRAIYGSIENNGTITTNTNTFAGGGAGNIWVQLNGTVDATGGRWTYAVGRLNWVGGTLVGPTYLQNGILDIFPTAPASTIFCEGNTDFIRNLSAGSEVRVQGNGTVGSAQLLPRSGAVNKGVIRLDSIDSAYASVISTLAGDFINDTGSAILSVPGAGGQRYMIGNTVNRGVIDATSNFLDIYTAYEAAGGRTINDVRLRNVQLEITAPSVVVHSLRLSGSCTLLTDVIDTNITLWVNGNGQDGNAGLVINANRVNNGRIRLESTDAAYASDLTGFGPGVTLTNNPGGIIESMPGFGGQRRIDGSVNNLGTINVLHNLDVGFQLTDQFVMSSGSINSFFSRFTFYSGTFNYVGGVFFGSPAYVYSGTIAVGVSGGASTIVAEGSCTLLNNASAATEIWVQGNGLLGNATLTTAAGAINYGTIRIESVDAAYQSALSATGVFINESSGNITSVAGSGGSRLIQGYVQNRGNIDATTYSLDYYGSYECNGGLALNNVRFHGINVLVTSPPIVPNTLQLMGATTLLTNNLPDMTLWVQGNGTDGGATMSVTGPITNAGTILLQSVDSSFTETLVVSGTLVNNGNLLTVVGAGGSRFIFCDDIDGTGVTDFQSGTQLVADHIRQSTVKLDNSQIQITANGGDPGLSVIQDLTLTGTSVFDLNNNDMILDYTGSTPLTIVDGLIASARNAGAWNGPGISSVAAQTNIAGNTTLGAIEATDYDSVYGPGALFDGVDPDDDSILIKYTYFGDTDFSGSIDFDDYVRIDTGFNTGLTGWFNGDNDQNGSIDFDDYVNIDNAFNTQGLPL